MGQVPVGMLNAIGQSNNFDVPKRVNINPNTTRNRLKTAGEYELRRESTLVVMCSTLRFWDLAVSRHTRTSCGRWGMGAPAARCASPLTADAMAEPIPDESGVSLPFPLNAKRGAEEILHPAFA